MSVDRMIKYVLWCSICCALRVHLVTGSQHPTMNKTQTKTDMNLTCNHNSSTVQWWHQKKHMFMIGFFNGTCFNTSRIPWFMDCDCNVPNYSCSITINACTIELLNNTIWQCSIVIDSVDFPSNEITLLIEEPQPPVHCQNQTQSDRPDVDRTWTSLIVILSMASVAVLLIVILMSTICLVSLRRKENKPKAEFVVELTDAPVERPSQLEENRRQSTARERSVQADTGVIKTLNKKLKQLFKPASAKANTSTEGASQSIPNLLDTEPIESVSDERGYPMTGKGYVLIINFTKDRPGSEKDEQDLLKLFQATLKYEVHVKTDLTLIEVRNVINNTKTNISKNYDCFVFIIMGHGDQNGIDTAHVGKVNKKKKEKLKVKYSYIRTEFTNKNMDQFAGLPKLIFINSCRGPNWQETFKKKHNNVQPDCSGAKTHVGTDADMFIFYSSVDGCKSARLVGNEPKAPPEFQGKPGTCFIQLCCQVFQERYDTDTITEMATEVNGKLQGAFPSQTSEFISTMRYPFYWKKK